MNGRTGFGADKPSDRVVPLEVAGLLASLTEKSLVVFDETDGRYRLLESVREYAANQIGSSECPWRSRHTTFFLALAEDAAQKLLGPEQSAWLDRLEEEHDNLRAALTVPGETSLKLTGLLWRYWMMRGYVTEGRQRCAALLAEYGAEQPSASLAAALHAAGSLAMVQSDYVEARPFLDRAAAMRRELGDRAGEAASLGNLATISQVEGDLVSAQRQFARGVDLFRQLGLYNDIAIGLTCLGTIAQAQGDYAAARDFISEAVLITRKTGNRAAEANALNNLGVVEKEAGNLDASRASFENALAINRELGFGWEISLNLTNLGSAAINDGDYESARKMLVEALTIMRDIGVTAAMVECLSIWARVEAACDQPVRSARLYGFYKAARTAAGMLLSEGDREATEAGISALRRALGDADFEKAFANGETVTLGEAVAYALDDVGEEEGQ